MPRLSAVDQAFFLLETPERPMNVGALLLLSVVIAWAGLAGMADSNEALRTVFADRTMPAAQLGEINDRMQPVTQAFYAAPFLDMHNRMKEAAVILGRQERAVVRPPLMKLSQSEIDRIAAGLKQARVGRDGAEDLDLDPIRGLAAE